MNGNSFEYGNKHECFECGCKFYDLNKTEPICPRCNTNQKGAPVAVQKVSQPRQVKTINEPEKETDFDDGIKSVDEDDFLEVENVPEEDNNSLF